MDTVKFDIQQTAYGENTAEGNSTACLSSPCDIEVDEHAHQIHLRAVQDENVIVQDSIYVPAVSESELWRFFFPFISVELWLTFDVCY